LLIYQGTEILPLFPLGGFVYTPNSEHILNIFEPRYRQMYNDILMNGAKRFVVATSHPNEEGRFAQTGVLFELEDLKEVSEQTQDKVKYICNHKVTGRVTLHKVLNPEAWSSRDTYLKVEGTILDDSGKSEAVVSPAKGDAKEEGQLRESFETLVDLQHVLEEDVRFTKGSISKLAVKDGPGQDGLWQTIRLWQSFADQRLMVRQNELQKDFQEKLQEFLKKEKGMTVDELPR
jgi:Lon protease-like protein